MLPVRTKHIPFADRIFVGLICDKCGEESQGPLSALDGRYSKRCRECGSRIELGSEHNRVLIEQLVQSLSRGVVAPHEAT